MTINNAFWPCAASLAALSCYPAPARGQQRSDENAVTQAEDGFGFSIGRETLGIYSADNARGFSPTEAGNVRIDGLYFDPAMNLTSGLVASTAVRVGLSAQGYPFAAPSGIVDERLRTPAPGAGASLVANFDQYGSAGLELNGSLPLSSDLGIGYGVSGSRVHFTDGTRAWQHSETLLAQWRAGRLHVTPFWSLFDDVDDTSNILFVPATPVLPKLPPAHHSQGPVWGAGRYTGTNLGLISSMDLGRNWLLRFDLVRSVGNQRHGFSNFLVDELPDGTGELITVADPPAINRAVSGEVRLTHSIADGPRLHVIHASVRGRDHRRQFGGSDVIDNGPATAGQVPNPPEPLFTFGELSRDWVRQLTFGVAYSGQWKNRGGLAFGLSRTNFRDTTSISGAETAKQTSSEWLYNVDGAVNLTRSIVLYAGYARGLEESGVAPANAANRHQPLPVILTEQTDAGVRFNLGPEVHAVVGAFDLSRPYFGYDAGNVFTKVGTTRSRGIEFSASGTIMPRLTVVAGGVLFEPRVTRDAGTVGLIGSRPVGLPTHDISLNANWQTPFAKQLELDVAVRHKGRTPSTTDNLVFVPARAQVDVGTHYHFKLADRNATLRLEVNNLFDTLGYGLADSGVYWRLAGRYALGYLTVDL